MEHDRNYAFEQGATDGTGYLGICRRDWRLDQDSVVLGPSRSDLIIATSKCSMPRRSNLIMIIETDILRFRKVSTTYVQF